MRSILAAIVLAFACVAALFSQVSKVWTADNGDGTYKNPIIHADYSDPDVIRVGSVRPERVARGENHGAATHAIQRAVDRERRHRCEGLPVRRGFELGADGRGDVGGRALALLLVAPLPLRQVVV